VRFVTSQRDAMEQQKRVASTDMSLASLSSLR